MCGISFVLSEDTYATGTDKFFRDSLITNQVRGTHSTGVFQITKAGVISTAKRALNASAFIETLDAKSLIEATPRSRATVGHVRHATQGGVSDKNAHPFLVTRPDKTRVVGVHNGTLRGWKDKEGGKDQDVDSAWAFVKFAEEGPFDAFEYFNGAFAFVWYDERYPDHIFMARNDERPLHFLISKDNKTIVGCSELGMLGWLAERNGIEISKKHGGSMFYVAPGYVYKFSLKNIGQFERTEYPKYDPATTIVQKPQTAVVNDTTHRYCGGASNNSVPFPAANSTYRPPLRWEQDARLKYVKSVFKRLRDEDDEASTALDAVHKGPARKDSDDDDTVITGDDLADSLEKALERELKDFKTRKDVETVASLDVWGLCNHKVVERFPAVGRATEAEKTLAEKNGLLGRIIPFNGVVWDDDTAELLGDFTILDAKGKPLTYDAYMRGVTGRLAETKYIKSNTPVPSTIIGLRLAEDSRSYYAVLAPMTDTGSKLLSTQLQQTALS